jgi:Ni,Fe-hydrogenase I cytochrome b subunit
MEIYSKMKTERIFAILNQILIWFQINLQFSMNKSQPHGMGIFLTFHFFIQDNNKPL